MRPVAEIIRYVHSGDIPRGFYRIRNSRATGLFFLFMVVFQILSLAPNAHAGMPEGLTKEEREIGRRAQAELERMFTFVENFALNDSLTKMANEISALSNRPAIDYKVRVIVGDYPNAFTVPGGLIYFTAAMMRELRSEHELAGVLAHEIAHNVRMHSIRRMDNIPLKTKLLSWASLAVLVLGKGSGESQAASIALSAASTAILNGYVLEDEEEADRYALQYLLKSRYNPVGYLTFWERMSLGSSRFIEEALGIYRTHPTSRARVKATRRYLEENKVRILRRLVNDPPKPRVLPRKVDDRICFAVRYHDRDMLLVASDGDDSDASRAEAAAAVIGAMLDYEVTRRELTVTEGEEGSAVLASSHGRIVITPGDADLSDLSPVRTAGNLARQICDVVIGEKTRINAMYAIF